MGFSLGSSLLFDAASSANRFIDIFITVYILLIFVYVLSSWVRLPYSPWLRRMQDFLRDVCEPYLRLFRRLLPSFGPLDLSPIVAVISLVILNLQGSETDLSKRLIDFASGLTYALDGGMQRIADKVFMLTPRNVEISAEERARLIEKGFFNQS